MRNDQEWTPPSSHDPNPSPPTADPTIRVTTSGKTTTVTPETLRQLPQRAVDNCLIVSTEHGASGPFTFAGATLLVVLERFAAGEWTVADIISADGFRTRVWRDELEARTERPILLALSIDGQPMGREHGLVRLIVPGEERDALRQVKWVSEVRVLDQPAASRP